MTELAFRDAGSLARMIRAREISSCELTELFTRRIEEHDEALNAVVVRDFERAREAAREADEEIAAGRATGPLHGVPMTIKESYGIAGLQTTWGVPALTGNVASTNAHAVTCFKNAEIGGFQPPPSFAEGT